MSKYTTEVRFICENAAGLKDSVGYNDVESVISAALPKVFSFSFPIFDENYRGVLETKILKHYYTREIGFETVGLWKLKLDTKLNEIMPYYNKMYESELLKFNPLYDTDLKTTNVGDKESKSEKKEDKTGFNTLSHNKEDQSQNERITTNIANDKRSGENSGESENNAFGSENRKTTSEGSDTNTVNKIGVASEKGSGTEDNVQRNTFSDTPQGGLTGLENNEYLTDARKIVDDNEHTNKTDKTAVDNETANRATSGCEEASAQTAQVGKDKSKGDFAERGESESLTSDVNKNTGSGTETQNGANIENLTARDKINSTESYITHVIGKAGGVSFSRMVQEFRETFLNIDMMIINDLSDLFMLLW